MGNHHAPLTSLQTGRQPLSSGWGRHGSAFRGCKETRWIYSTARKIWIPGSTLQSWSSTCCHHFLDEWLVCSCPSELCVFLCKMLSYLILDSSPKLYLWSQTGLNEDRGCYPQRCKFPAPVGTSSCVLSSTLDQQVQKNSGSSRHLSPTSHWCTPAILTADPRYPPPVWMTEGRISRHVAWLAPLTPLAGGRWQMEEGTPASPTEARPGVPTAPRATCWKNSTATDTGPPRRWAGSSSSTHLLMVSPGCGNGPLLPWQHMLCHWQQRLIENSRLVSHKSKSGLEFKRKAICYIRKWIKNTVRFGVSSS